MSCPLASVLLAVQAAAGGAAAPPAFTFSQELLAFAPRDAGKPFEDQWVSEAEGKLWVLDPGQKVLRCFVGLTEQRVVPWPPHTQQSQPLGVAAAKEGVFFVEKQAGRVWRLFGEKWQGPWRVPGPVGGLTALTDGSLWLNVPGGESATFLVLNAAGAVVRAFGAPLPPEHPSLREQANTWSLARLGQGRVVAAHRFLPLLRFYREDGTLLAEREMSSPAAKSAKKRRQELLGQARPAGTGCCLSFTLPVFATAVLPGPQEGFYLHLGSTSSLELYDAQGRFVGPVAVVEPRATPQMLARSRGLAMSDEALVVASGSGVALFRPGAGGEMVRGLVLDPEGAGVAGARVVVTLATSQGGTGASLAPATTDSAGAFSMSLPQGSTHGRVQVRAPGFREVVRTGSLREILSEPITLPKAEEYCVRLEVPPGAREPEKFQVTLQKRTVTGSSAGVEAGPSAEFHPGAERPCLAAPWGAPVVVAVQAPGFARAAKRAETPGWVTVVLEPEARVELRAFFSDGEPAVGAKVVLRPGGPEEAQKPARVWSAEEEAEVDQEGWAHLAGFAPGAYVLQVVHEAALPWEKPVELAVGDNQLTVELSRGAVVVLQVLDPQGNPVAGAGVTLSGGRKPSGCTTDTQGGCAMQPVARGSYRVWVESARYGTLSRQLAIVEDREYRLALRFPGSLQVRGEVRGVEHYPELVLVVQAENLGESHVAQVEPGGAFTLEGLSPGEWVFWVEDRVSELTLASKAVHLSERGPGERVVIELPPPKVVKGMVRVKEGTRHRGCGACELSFRLASPQAGAPVVTAATQGDGSYEVRLPIAGNYLVLVEDKDSGIKAEFVVQVDRSLERDFLLAGLALTGRVWQASGSPAPGVAVRLLFESASEPLLETLTDEDGHFSFRPGKPGSYLVQAVGRDGVVGQRVELRPGLEREVELRFDEQGHQVRVRLRSASSGALVGSVGVRIMAPGSPPVVFPLLLATEGMVTLPFPGSGAGAVVVESLGFGRVLVGGVQAGGEVVEVLLPEAGAIHLRSAAGPLCRVLLQDLLGQAYPLSLDFDPGFVPVRGEEVTLTRIAAGSYVLTGELCSGRRQRVPITVAPGTITTVKLGQR